MPTERESKAGTQPQPQNGEKVKAVVVVRRSDVTANRHGYLHASTLAALRRLRKRQQQRVAAYAKRKGGRQIVLDDKRPTIEEMRKAMGLGPIQPIHVSPGAQETMSGADEMWKWYEEELSEVYAEYED
ncbi:hypothetical protein [Alicyclobacillus macrosporangiidus]|uniref:hypothetical protein n=1 Tax=Alicyclobacillus macrosporangiidus TaxID=392015 RepID=UPI0011146A63|nr:hypothetical protein [Alicyclobacillus macrosporangiidus]